MPVTAFQVDIVKAIREAFDQLRFFFRADVGRRVWAPWQEDPLEGRTGWTQAINTTLCRIGQEHFGMGVGSSPDKVAAGTHLDYGEWLYDITWCDEDDEGRMSGLPLVAECEWEHRSAAIVEDFQKLLVARAGVRLMIHENWMEREEIPHPSDMAKHLAQRVSAFACTQPDDVYLLVVLDVHELTADGFHSIRYFRLGADGAAVEWIKGEPSPLVANAPWVVYPEDLEC